MISRQSVIHEILGHTFSAVQFAQCMGPRTDLFPHTLARLAEKPDRYLTTGIQFSSVPAFGRCWKWTPDAGATISAAGPLAAFASRCPERKFDVTTREQVIELITLEPTVSSSDIEGASKEGELSFTLLNLIMRIARHMALNRMDQVDRFREDFGRAGERVYMRPTDVVAWCLGEIDHLPVFKTMALDGLNKAFAELLSDDSPESQFYLDKEWLGGIVKRKPAERPVKEEEVSA